MTRDETKIGCRMARALFPRILRMNVDAVCERVR